MPVAALSAIFFVAVLLRLALVMHVAPYPERFIREDAVGYNQLAINLAQNNGFSMSQDAPYVPDNFRTPGYPLFVAAIYVMAGYSPVLVLVVQALLSALTSLLIYALGSALFGRGVGLWSAGLFAVAPISITYSAVLWAETLFVLLLSLGLWLLVRGWQRQSIWLVAVAAFTLGVATLVHPRSLYLGVLLAGMLGLRGLLTRDIRLWFRQGVVVGFVFLMAFVLPLAPWIWRNQQTFGTANVASVTGQNLLFYRAALVEVELYGGDQWEIARRLEAEARARLPETPPPTEAELSNVYAELAVEKLREHPITYAWVHLKGTLRVLLPGTFTIQTLLQGTDSNVAGVYEFLIAGSTTQSLWASFRASIGGLSTIIILIDALYLLIIYLAALAGAWRMRTSPWLFGMLITIGYLALINGPASGPRFRLAFMPMLLILAAIGITQQLSKRRPVPVSTTFDRQLSSKLPDRLQL